MPHLIIAYSGQLDTETDMRALCRSLADTMCAQRDEVGEPVFPIGGVRVLAYPAAHWAVADGQDDAGFVYLNLRIGKGRSGAVHRQVGQALVDAVHARLGPLLAQRPLGLTLQIDEGAEVFNVKLGNLHSLHSKKKA